MSLSVNMKLAQFARDTGKVVVGLITISSSELADDINITTNNEDVTSNGTVFSATKCDIILPDNDPDSDPATTISICNVTQQIDTLLLPLTKKPTVTVSYALADTPDTIEIGPMAFVLESTSSDAFVLEGTLSGNSELNEIVPKNDINPTDFPGSF